MNNQGFFLMTGKGIQADLEKAKFILTEALALGSKMAAYNLDVLDSTYHGKLDYASSLKYLLIAEATNDPDVLFELGLHYQNGRGTAIDHARAKAYYTRAEQQGSGYAAGNLVIIWLEEELIKSEYLSYQLISTSLAFLQRHTTEQMPMIVFLSSILQLILDRSDDMKEKVIGLLSLACNAPPEKLSVRLETPETIAQSSSSSISSVTVHDKLTFVILYLSQVKDITPVELLAFLQPDINSLATMKAYLDMLKLEDRPLPQPKETTTVKLAAEQLDEAAAFTTEAQRRLFREIDWFVAPGNQKIIDFRNFKQIICKISAAFPQISSRIKPSKGSSVSLRIEIPGGAPICYSFHEIHRSGQGVGSTYDPGRAASMQQIVKQISHDLKEKRKL